MRAFVAASAFALALAAPDCFTVKKSTGNVRQKTDAYLSSRSHRAAPTTAHPVLPPPQALCWEHTVTAGVLRVNMSCGVDALNGKPSFCAVGFHQQGDASTKMAPAEVFFTAVVNGKAVIEDRYDKAGHSESVCAPKQMSYDVVSNVNNDGR